MPRPSIASSACCLLVAAASGCERAQPWDRIDFQPSAPPVRIALASVLAAESLLGVLRPERIAGVHVLAADPRFSLVAEQAAALPLVGAEPEDLLAVRPDLVLVDAYTRAETLALLAAADVPLVRALDPHGFDDIEANLRRFGRIAHIESEAAVLVQWMRAELDAIAAAGAEVRSWRVLGLDGALHTYGAGSLFDALMTAAGARNLAREHGVGAFRKLDVETVLALRPDALVFAIEPGEPAGAPAWLQQWPGLDLLPCVRRGRLIGVPGPLLSTTSHRLVEAAGFVQRQLLAWGSP